VFSAIGQIIGLIRALLDLFKYFKAWQEAELAKEAAKKREKREKAVDHSKGANTDEEIWDDQEKIVETKP